MVEKYSIRTDLALEEKERFEEENVEVQGVVLEEEYDEEWEVRTTTVIIKTENGAKTMGKPVGTYITMEAPNLAVPDEAYHREISVKIAECVERLLRHKWKRQEKRDTGEDVSVLMVGLGNRAVTPDALGPRVADNLNITRHIVREYGKYAMGEDEVTLVRPCSRCDGSDRNGDSGDRKGRRGGDKTGGDSRGRCPGSEEFQASEPDDPDYRHRDQSRIRRGEPPQCHHRGKRRGSGDCHRSADCRGRCHYCQRRHGEFDERDGTLRDP